MAALGTIINDALNIPENLRQNSFDDRNPQEKY